MIRWVYSPVFHNPSQAVWKVREISSGLQYSTVGWNLKKKYSIRNLLGFLTTEWFGRLIQYCFLTWFFKFSRIVYSSLSALYEFCHNILEIWHHLEQYSVILTRFLKKFARLIFILIFWNGWRCCKGRHSYQKFTTKFAVFWHFYKCFVKFCFNLTKNEKLFLTNEIENEQISKFHRFRKSGQNNWILLEISSKH